MYAILWDKPISNYVFMKPTQYVQYFKVLRIPSYVNTRSSTPLNLNSVINAAPFSFGVSNIKETLEPGHLINKEHERIDLKNDHRPR